MPEHQPHRLAQIATKLLSAMSLPCCAWSLNVHCWYQHYMLLKVFLRLLCFMVYMKTLVHILLLTFDWLPNHSVTNLGVFLPPRSTNFCLAFSHPINHMSKTFTWKGDKEPSLVFNYFNLGTICCKSLHMELWSYLNRTSESTVLLHMPAMLGHN